MKTLDELSDLQERYPKAFFESLLIAMFICLLPFKSIGSLVPFVCVFWFIVRSKSGKSFKKLFYVFLFWGAMLGFYSWLYYMSDLSFNISNGLLSFITYSSVLVFAFPAIITSKDYSYEKYANLIIGIIFIEGIWGIAQRVLAPIFLGANSSGGDVVEGTINPFSFISGHSGFSNQFYVINMLCFIVFCFPMVFRQKKTVIAFVVGIIGVILASVGHVFISLLVAVIITFLYFEGPALLVKPKILFASVFILVSMVAVFASLDTEVFQNTDRQFEMFINGKTPKSEALIKVFTVLGEEQPGMHLVGVGPGHYSSRAGVIASGTYGALSDLFVGLPFLNVGISAGFKAYVLDEWLFVSNNTAAFGNSTMYRPFFSLLSVYSEFGGVVFFILLSLFLVHIYKLKEYYIKFKKDSSKKQYQKLTYCSSVISLLLLIVGVYENYYETPQGIFVGLLLILILQSVLHSASIKPVCNLSHSTDSSLTQ